MADVLQKLLMPWLSQAVGDRGHPYVGGPVVRMVDVGHLQTARALVDAFDLRSSAAFVDDPPFVDVLRFEVEPMMNLDTPAMTTRPWPTYPMGFLTGPGAGMTPVWVLERTRVPRGTEMWRIHADGRQEMVTRFDGMAHGWRGARGYTPPTHMVGPRATVDGVEYPAELLDPGPSEVQLVHLGEDLPRGFETARPRVAVRTVPIREVSELRAVQLSASWLDMTVRVLHPGADDALVAVEQPTVAQVERSRFDEVEPGYYEGLAPKAELSSTGGVGTEIPLRHHPRADDEGGALPLA